MNSSPEVTVLRGDRAGSVTAARFAVDLRIPTQLTGDQARERAEAYADAKAAGYAAGWAEGRRAAAEAAAAEAEAAQAAAAQHVMRYVLQIKQAIGALAAAADRLDQHAVPGLAELEQATIGTALAIAEAVVGRELASAAEPGMDAMRRALGVVPAGRPVTVRLHPKDLATVVENLGSNTSTVDGRTVTLIADPSLRPGDATAECDATTVESRVDSAIDRVREVLLGGESR